MKEKNNCFYIISCLVDFVAKYTSFHNSYVFHLMRLLLIIFIYMWGVVELLPFMALRILCRTEAINNHFILHIFFRLLITRCCLLRIFQPNLQISTCLSMVICFLRVDLSVTFMIQVMLFYMNIHTGVLIHFLG